MQGADRRDPGAGCRSGRGRPGLGVLACPHCAGALRPWAWARPRRIRQLDGSTRTVRPRRARCAACRRTTVLLPAWCLPRRADATAVVGAALGAKATGHGYRRIAADLARPASTVRRWLRAARGEHAERLRRQGVAHAARLDPSVLADLSPQPRPLGDALCALAAAVSAAHRHLGEPVDGWTLIGILTGGRLLAPSPSG